MIHNENAQRTGTVQIGVRHNAGEACGNDRRAVSHCQPVADGKNKAKQAVCIQDRKAPEGKKEMTAVLYARVSSEKQEKQETIQSQIAELRKFAKEKGYVIVNEYFDEGYSGEMLARPHLDRMRDHAREKLFQTVLIYSPDRLSRKYVYQELLKMELKKHGVEIIFINNPEKHDKPEDRLLEGIQGLIAEYEKAQIIDRTRRGRLYKARQGVLISSIGPYGYKYVKKNADGKKDG